MARAGSLKDVCVSSQLGVFFGWVFFLEGGLGYTRHSGVTYAGVVGFARTGERGGEGAVGHQGCAKKGRPVVVCSLSFPLILYLGDNAYPHTLRARMVLRPPNPNQPPPRCNGNAESCSMTHQMNGVRVRFAH